MFGLRLLTATVLLAVFIAALWWLPRAGWALLMVVITVVAAREWGALARLSPRVVWAYAAGLGAIAALALPAGLHSVATVQMPSLALNVVFWWCVALPIVARRAIALSRIQAALCGVIVLVPTCWSFIALQPQPRGFLLLLGVIFIADTAAYLVGRRWGRRKLAPSVSPGKTWEGLYGALVAVLLYALVTHRWLAVDFPRLSLAAWCVLAVTMMLFGVIGDLFESWLKRRAQVKDSGHLLPGHGGLLDRLDALTAAIPFAALVVLWPW